MVELAEIGLILQTISVMSAATAAVIGVRSYINSNKRAGEAKQKEQETRDRELETRKAQFYMQIYQQLTSEASTRRWVDMMNMEWKDYDDFERKYGSDDHPDLYSKRTSALYEFNGVGHLLKEGLIDMDTAYGLTEVQGLWLWRKFEPMVRELRVRYNVPEIYADLEFLAAETTKRLEERGYSSKIPEGLTHYTGKASP
jgi:hypothetical protein